MPGDNDLHEVERRIEEVHRLLATHDGKMENVAQSLREGQAMMGHAIVEIRDASMRSAAALEKLSKNGNGHLDVNRLFLWLVLAVVLSSIGTKGVELLAHMAGIRP